MSAPAQTAHAASLTREEVLALVARDLAQVEKAIELETVCSVEAVTAISHHLQGSGGKRLRPMLLMLAARAAGHRGDGAIRMGAVVEIVHTATLVHDDVIDEAEVRRGRSSTNQEWGNPVSVLAGDWLYMQAFNLTLRERNFAMLDRLIELTQTMVEGELIQHDLVGRVDLSEQEYLDLIHRKTAVLFSVCCRYGAMLAESDPEAEQRLADYGWNLGMAFQLVDDVLDFAATEETLGKPVGNDLREGKVTLPLILALRTASDEERALVEQVVRDESYENVSAAQIQAILARHDSIATVRRQALDYTSKALECLAGLPATPHRRALESVVDWIVDRQS